MIACEQSCAWARVSDEARATDFHSDAFDPRFVSVDGLDVARAWALATQWTDRLRGVVRLGWDLTNTQFSVAPNYEWIDVRVGCSADSRVSNVTRAALLVWRALASCRGFSAREHPVFWRCVFDGIATSDSPDPLSCCGNQNDPWLSWRHDPYKFFSRYSILSDVYHVQAEQAFPYRCVVSDAYRFFDGVAFPRVRLVFCQNLDASDMNDKLRRDLRILSGEIDCEILQAQVEAAVRTLEPFMCRERLEHLNAIECHFSLRPEYMSEDDDLNTLIDLLQHSERSVDGSVFDLPLVVTAVETGDRFGSLLNRYFPEHIAFGRGLRIPIARRRIIRGSESNEGGEYVPGFSTFREYVLWALNPTPQPTAKSTSRNTGGGIQHLMFGHDFDQYAVPAICSALPFTTTLETFTLDSTHHWQNRLAVSDIAWLGYALFHPATSSSTWKRLWIRNVGNQYADPDALALMAQGNNLARVLGMTEHVASAYFSATIRNGAVIRSKPACDDGVVVDVLSETTEMDVCVESTDVSLLSEFVLVVVVGYGAAWVHRDSVECIIERPPGCPELTGLSVEGSLLPERILKTLVQRVSTRGLEFLCAGDSVLRASDIEQFRIPSISAGVFEKLYVSPDVRELRINTNAPINMFKFVPQLVQLRNLETLIIRTVIAWDESFLERLQELLQWLMRRLPRLQRFAFIDTSAPNDEMNELGYSAMRYISRRLLGFGRKESSSSHIFASGFPSATTVVALLSVVAQHRARGIAALGRLDTPLVRMIAEFVGRDVPLALWMSMPKQRRPFQVWDPTWQPPLVSDDTDY